MGVFFCPFFLVLFPRLPYNVAMKDKELKVKVDDEFIDKVDFLRLVHQFKTRSETVRRIVEKEYIKETVEGLPASINITGINGKGYVKIVQMFDFPTYYRYDLDVYDEHGDAISVYIPKRKEKEDGRK